MTEPGTLTTSVAGVIEWLFEPSTLDSTSGLEPTVELAARLLFLDTLGCTIGGGAKPELKTLNSALANLEPGTVSVPGMTGPLTAPAAASWCATAATWDEACEGLARAHGRPGLHAFPVALALALDAGATLGDALIALVRGFEVGGRLGERLRIQAGMHVDGTWGTFGAVVAAGSILGHDTETIIAAIEAAACQTPMSLYLPVAQGASIRNSYVAEAARRAITLSLHAESGLTTPTGGLEVVDELAFGAGKTSSAIAPTGEWLITQGYLKPYAAVRHVHYGAEAARRWRRSEQATYEIEALSLDVYPEAVTYCGNRAPITAIAAQFSLTYGIARMLVAGDLGPDSYTADSLKDPELRRLERLIEVRAIPGASPDERYATLHITTATGGVQSIRIARVAGDADNPMGVDDVTTKFVDYSSWLAGWPAEKVAAAVLRDPLDTPLASVVKISA